MGIPDEDKGPVWLREYGEGSGHLATDPRFGYQHERGTFAVDLTGLKEFGTKLQNELELDYVPHANTAFEYMKTTPSNVPSGFLELLDATRQQAFELQQVSTNLANHSEAVVTIAKFAVDVATKYGNADALAATRVADAKAGLQNPAAATPITQPTDPANPAAPTGSQF